MYRVIDTTSGAPGLLEFRACREPAGRYLAGFSRWESLEDFRAALPTIRSLAPLRNPDWSTRPADVITLGEAERSPAWGNRSALPRRCGALIGASTTRAADQP